jgi:Na+/H+ antiporter NhaA
MVAGIGLTMALFIAQLAFPSGTGLKQRNSQFFVGQVWLGPHHSLLAIEF